MSRTIISPGVIAGAQKHTVSPPAWSPAAVHFDGSTSIHTESLTNTDTPFFLYSIWFRYVAANDQASNLVFSVDPENSYNTSASLNGAGTPGSRQITTFMGNVAGSSSFKETTSTYADDTWHNLLFSGDGSVDPKVAQVYIDDVVQPAAGSNFGPSPFNIETNGLSFWFADDSIEDALYVGDYADFQMFRLASALDLSITANRRLFIDGSGAPVSPFTAAGTLGTQTILFYGGASNFGTNWGTGGSFITVGTLTNAATHP